MGGDNDGLQLNDNDGLQSNALRIEYKRMYYYYYLRTGVGGVSVPTQ